MIITSWCTCASREERQIDNESITCYALQNQGQGSDSIVSFISHLKWGMKTCCTRVQQRCKDVKLLCNINSSPVWARWSSASEFQKLSFKLILTVLMHLPAQQQACLQKQPLLFLLLQLTLWHYWSTAQYAYLISAIKWLVTNQVTYIGLMLFFRLL